MHSLRIIIVDDSDACAQTLVRHLQENGHEVVFERVDEAAAMASLLQGKTWDLLLSGHNMPHFNSLAALKVLQQSGVDLPFIIVSGAIKTEEVVAALQAGAHDFIPMSDLSRLVPAMDRELRQAELRRENREVQETIARSEAHFRSLIESSPDIIAILDVQGFIKYISPSLYDILGFSPPEVLERNFIDFVHPEEQKEVLNIFRQKTENPGEPIHFQNRIRHKSGAWRHVKAVVTLRLKAHEPPELVVSASDVTELLESEQHAKELKLMLDQAQEAVVVQDLEGRIIYFNKGAELISGWKASEVLGRNLAADLRLDPGELEKGKKELQARGEWHGELTLQRKDGNKIIVDVHWTLVRDTQGQPKSILTVSSDITEKKKLENQYLRAQRMESIGALASGIAHDLNNVLSPMMMCLPLLREKVSDPTLQNLTATLEASIQRGAGMLKQLLGFGRGFEGNHVALELPHLLREIVRIVQETFPKNIQVGLQYAKDLWSITGDPTQLHQVLLNLCINARDAMPDGGHLSIQAENIQLDELYAAMNPDAQASRYALIKVIDSGQGIPPEILGKIFDPFFTTKEPGKGTGLGLSTAQGIVKRHSGFIRVESRVNEGAEFQIYLPAICEAISAGAPLSAEAPCCGRGETVLVIDDEPSMQIVTRRALETHGYRVLSASDGTEALSQFVAHSRKVNLVLSDIVMPVLDGPATVRALRHMEPKLKVVWMSGHQALERYPGESATELFLRKPFSVQELLQILDQALKAPSLGKN